MTFLGLPGLGFLESQLPRTRNAHVTNEDSRGMEGRNASRWSVRRVSMRSAKDGKYRS